ncbi:MAG: 4'-phosphopantetheinyl transferase superfamily protein [Gammaproteobacteria bacterium]
MAEPVEAGWVHVWPFTFDARGHTRELMRHILSLYCGVDASALEFVTGEFGKPALVPHGVQPHPVSFNLTHSERKALLAVADGRPIGVDLEHVSRRTDALALSSRYFSSAEAEQVRDAPEVNRQEVFFRLWTAKEAVMKAQGRGLNAPLDSFRVIFDEGYGTATVESFDSARIEPGWFVRSLPSEEGWFAAVAAKTSAWQVRMVDVSGATSSG